MKQEHSREISRVGGCGGATNPYPPSALRQRKSAHTVSRQSSRNAEMGLVNLAKFGVQAIWEGRRERREREGGEERW